MKQESLIWICLILTALALIIMGEDIRVLKAQVQTSASVGITEQNRYTTCVAECNKLK